MLILVQNLCLKGGIVLLVAAISLRSGHPEAPVVFGGFYLLWVLTHGYFLYVSPNIHARFMVSASGGAVLSLLGFIRIANKVGQRNFADNCVAISLLFAVVVIVIHAALNSSGLLGGESVVNSFLAWMPSLMLGVGVFLLQSYSLDAFDQLQVQAQTDKLTGLYNRRGFDKELANAIALARRYQRSLSLVMVDIDYFKPINDEYGHPFGDRVIQEFGRMLKTNSRDVDTVARIGGEEFVIVLPEIDSNSAMQFAERLREATKNMQIGGVKISASFGVSGMEENDYSSSALIRAADTALYRAKDGGRDRVEGAALSLGAESPQV